MFKDNSESKLLGNCLKLKFKEIVKSEFEGYDRFHLSMGRHDAIKLTRADLLTYCKNPKITNLTKIPKNTKYEFCNLYILQNKS